MIPGSAAFASTPIAGLTFTAGELSAERVVYVPRTLRFASQSFATKVDDNPPSTQIVGRLRPLTWRSSIGTDELGRYAGASPLGFGDIEFENEDGGMDAVVNRAVTDGAKIRVKVGSITRDRYGRPIYPAYEDLQQLFEATSEQWTVNERNPTLNLRDASIRLERPVQPNLYTGAGDKYGTADLAGLNIPFGYGMIRGATPTLVDPDRWIYQVNDLSTLSIDTVSDAGKPLIASEEMESYDALRDTVVEGGTYKVCLTGGGWFRLGAQPFGIVTVDFRGSKEARRRSFFADGTGFTDRSGFANTTADQYVDTGASIVSRIVTDRNIIRPLDVENGSFSRVDRDQPAVLGYYQPTGDNPLASEVVDRIARSLGCWFGQSTYGRFVFVRFEIPSKGKLRQLTDRHIISMRKVRLPYRTPYYSWQVTARRNWTPLSPENLVAGIDPSRVQFLTRSVTIAAVNDLTIARAYKSSRVARVNGYFDSYTDAATEATRLAELYSTERAVWEVTVPILGTRFERGQTVNVKYRHPGFTQGKPVVIVGVDIALNPARVILTVFG